MYLSDSWLEQAARTRKGSYTRREVCALGSWEGDFYGDIHPEPGEPIVTKHRYSAFYNTDLDLILRSHGYPYDCFDRCCHKCLRGNDRA